MADEKSYLSYTGLVKLVEKIKSLVSTAAAKAVKDASTYSDSSLKAHIDAVDASNNSIHVSLADRQKWDNAASVAAGTVSKEDYDKKVKELTDTDASITTALGKTDASLKLTDGSLDAHITNATVHITAAERTKWNKVVDDLSTHSSDGDIHVGAGEKDKWNEWHEASANYYKASEVDEKIGALGAVFNFKGTITKAELAGKLESANVGDVWHISDEQGNEYVCVKDSSTSEKRWEDLGHTVDLSAYATTAYVTTEIGKITSGDISTLKSDVKKLQDASATHALKSDLDALDTRVTAAEGKITTLEGAGYATKIYVDGKFTDSAVTFAGTAANATLAADATKLGNLDASEYALKSELAEQMVEAILDASIAELFN